MVPIRAYAKKSTYLPIPGFGGVLLLALISGVVSAALRLSFHRMRLDILAQLHTLTQLPFDHKSLMPLVLSGQNILIDRLLHHLRIADGKEELFAEEAITAVHQGSGGLLRRANYLVRGAMLASAAEQAPVITAEHVRLASTEIL